MNLEISLENLRYNVRLIKLRACGAKVIAVVKANAYGHGAVKIAQTIHSDVYAFAVANGREALELTSAGITEPIFVLGGIISDTPYPENVIPSVSCERDVFAVKGKCAGVAIALNTGMNRYGCEPGKLGNLVNTAKKNGLDVIHVFTHIADESDEEFSLKQLSGFLLATGEDKIERSAAATCALNLGKPFCMDCIRVGIGLYGYGSEELKPIASAFAYVTAIRRVKKGDRIGYGKHFADRNMKIAIVAAGYADGLMRRRSDLFACINGIKCRAVGQICMDASFYDVTEARCVAGDKAYFIGYGAEMSDLCTTYDTIPYEILTAFDRRSDKIYV